MLYLRTPTGRIACLRNHAVDAKGVVTPSIKVSWPQDGREVVDWHVGSPSPAEAAVLLGWGPQDAERYAEQARQWPKAKG